MNTGKTLYAQLMDFLPWTTPGTLRAKKATRAFTR